MNFNYEIEKINPINISAEEFNIHKIPNNARKSIALYNKSILNLKIDCADLAITDLKKALSLNTDFCEAIKLLGLCYVCTKDFNKAEKVFKKLAKYNIHTILANDYLQELKAERTISRALDTIKSASSNSDNNTKSNTILKPLRSSFKIKKISVFQKRLFISFLVSTIIITTLGLSYWKRSNIQSMFNKVQNTEVKKNKELEQQKVVNEKYTQMDEDYKKLQKNLETTKSELDNYKNKNNIISTLNEAEKLYADGDHEKALDNLIMLKALKLEDTEKSRLDKLWNSIKTNDLWTIYNQGNSLYKQGKYQEALPKLVKVQQIAPELSIMPWVLYQIGTCYKQTNDNKNALNLFRKVKNDYPNTEYAGYSEGMISEINSKVN